MVTRAVGLQAEIDTAGMGMGDPLKRENAELRAEIERLKAATEARYKLFKARIEEIEQLRMDLNAQQAEVERLKHLHNLDHSLADQREAEVERLQAALREIMQGARSLDYAIHVARVALGRAAESP